MASYPFTSALITGASSGIGEAMVRELGRAGIPQVVVARRARPAGAARRDVRRRRGARRRPDHRRRAWPRWPTRSSIVDEPIDLAGEQRRLRHAAGCSPSSTPIGSTRRSGLNVGALTRLSRAALGVMIPRGAASCSTSAASSASSRRRASRCTRRPRPTSRRCPRACTRRCAAPACKVTALCPGLTRTEFQDVSSSSTVTDRAAVVRLADRRGGRRHRAARHGRRSGAVDPRTDEQERRHGQRDHAARHAPADERASSAR